MRDGDAAGSPPRPVLLPLDLKKADVGGSAIDDHPSEVEVSPLAGPVNDAIRVGRERLASQGSQIDCNSIDGYKNAT